jgi:hypothetical protein
MTGGAGGRGSGDGDAAAAPAPRWGLRTLAFLALAAASIVLPQQARERGVEVLNLVGFLGLIAGLIGAGVCTVRGIQALLAARGPR